MAVQNKLLMAGRRTIAGLASAMIVIMASLEAARANLDDLQLQGMGTLRWMGLKIYEARLFASKRPNPAQLTQLPFALELTYARDFNGSSIAERSIDEIKKLGIGSTEQHQAWRGRMQAIFPNVKSGDRIRGIHRPGSGAGRRWRARPGPVGAAFPHWAGSPRCAGPPVHRRPPLGGCAAAWRSAS